MAGIGRSTATNTSLVMALMPVMSVLAGAWVFGDRVATRTWSGLACGFAGVALAVIGSAGAALHMPGTVELLLCLGLVAFIAFSAYRCRAVGDVPRPAAGTGPGTCACV